MLFAYSNKLGCGGSLLVSVVGSVLLIGAMFLLNSCLAGGSPRVGPGPEASRGVGVGVGVVVGETAAPDATPRTGDPGGDSR